MLVKKKKKKNMIVYRNAFSLQYRQREGKPGAFGLLEVPRHADFSLAICHPRAQGELRQAVKKTKQMQQEYQGN